MELFNITREIAGQLFSLDLETMWDGQRFVRSQSPSGYIAVVCVVVQVMCTTLMIFRYVTHRDA